MLVIKFKPPARCRVGDEDLKEFELRETDGKDESNATVSAKGKANSGNYVEELLSMSLVSVNGKAVNQGVPYVDFPKWNSRARAFALKAWQFVNGMGDDEETPFVQGAETALKV